MTPNPENQQKMERLIHRTLSDLPLRSAPASLEKRVLAEIERRAALPWWRKSFAHWPLAARAVFVLVSAGLVKLAYATGVWAMAGFDSAQYPRVMAVPFSWVESGLAVIHGVGAFFEIMARTIPPVWLYAGMAFLATMYFALFGLGAVAYKALLVRR